MKRRVLIMGGLGYLGWSLGLSLSSTTDAEVVLVDNQAKRDWARTAGGVAINADFSVNDRLAELRSQFGRAPRHVACDATDYESLSEVFAEVRPNAVVNCAHQPSAPYSELSHETAAFTMRNNNGTHLCALWCLLKLDGSAKYIEINSAGTLNDVHVERVPPHKVSLTFTLDETEQRIADTWLPMQASDVYHVSKAQNFLLSEMFASRFGLAITSVRQSVIFGASAVERALPRSLMPPLYYDACFGTVVNRFVLQRAAGIRPTVYGSGEQCTGVISLADAVDSLVRCCLSEGKRGTLDVVHNQTAVLSVRTLAALVNRENPPPDIADGDRAHKPVRRRLAPSEIGPASRSIDEIASQLACFERLISPQAGEFNVDRLAAVCPRGGY